MIQPQRPASLTSPSSLWHRLTRRVCRLWERSDWPDFAGADWSDKIMKTGVTDDFHAKQGRSTGRLILEQGSKRFGVYLKRHYRLPWWKGWLAAFFPGPRWSPGLEEFRNLEWAQEQGLPVPAPVAVSEYIGPWGQLQSVLVIEELTGMLGLHQAIPLASQRLTPIHFRQWKKRLGRELARLARCLHDRRVFHKDLYLCHFFVAETDTATVPDFVGRIQMIDFHRLAQHRWTWPIWLIKDLGQFLFSSDLEGVNDRDRLWFWHCYTGTPRTARTWLAWLVRWKFVMYRRHNAKALQKQTRRAA